MGVKEKLLARAIDLRKAYKQLPLDKASLPHACICVYCPRTGKPEIYMGRVLPFGSRAAVVGFCRTSRALHHVGVKLFRLRWTTLNDDFLLVCAEQESRHLDVIQKCFFSVLGWDTAEEKDLGFRETARVLGVEMCLKSARFGCVIITNTAERKAEVAEAIDVVLRGRHVASSTLVSLRGRLLFAENQVFGRRAVQNMRVVSDACNSGGMIKLDDELRTCLLYTSPSPRATRRLSLIHISEPTRLESKSRITSSA